MRRKPKASSQHGASREQRKNEKRQARRRTHVDKYGHRILESKLEQLVRRFNDEEADGE